jgi:hypothetical protein
MSYVVTSTHPECLESGRMVAPGAEISNTEARKNQRLIDRGALTERPTKKAKPASKSPAPEPEPKPPAPKPEPKKEDDK